MVPFQILNTPYNTYFVTLTYRQPVDHWQQWKKDIRTLLQYLNNAGSFELVCEIGKKGQFHWHYIIRIKDDIKHNRFLNHWTSSRGFIDIKPVRNYLGSFIYIRKTSLMMGEFLEEKLRTTKTPPEKGEQFYFCIINNSTAPFILKALRTIISYTNRSTKKINELQQTINKIKGSLDEYYDIN